MPHEQPTHSHTHIYTQIFLSAPQIKGLNENINSFNSVIHSWEKYRHSVEVEHTLTPTIFYMLGDENKKKNYYKRKKK